jgi:hypothetical protein
LVRLSTESTNGIKDLARVSPLLPILFSASRRGANSAFCRSFNAGFTFRSDYVLQFQLNFIDRLAQIDLRGKWIHTNPKRFQFALPR